MPERPQRNLSFIKDEIVFHPFWMKDETIFHPWMKDEGFRALKRTPLIRKVEKRLACGVMVQPWFDTANDGDPSKDYISIYS
jgi:hypothetical protein